MNTRERISKMLNPLFLLQFPAKQEITNTDGKKILANVMASIGLTNFEVVIEKYSAYRWEIHEKQHLNYSEYIEEEKNTFKDIKPDFTRQQLIVFNRYLEHIENNKQKTNADNNGFTARERLLLLYKIMDNREVFDELTPNSKSKIIANLITANPDNLRKFYPLNTGYGKEEENSNSKSTIEEYWGKQIKN